MDIMRSLESLCQKVLASENEVLAKRFIIHLLNAYLSKPFVEGYKFSFLD